MSHKSSHICKSCFGSCCNRPRIQASAHCCCVLSKDIDHGSKCKNCVPLFEATEDGDTLVLFFFVTFSYFFVTAPLWTQPLCSLPPSVVLPSVNSSQGRGERCRCFRHRLFWWGGHQGHQGKARSNVQTLHLLPTYCPENIRKLEGHDSDDGEMAVWRWICMPSLSSAHTTRWWTSVGWC